MLQPFKEGHVGMLEYQGPLTVWDPSPVCSQVTVRKQILKDYAPFQHSAFSLKSVHCSVPLVGYQERLFFEVNTLTGSMTFSTRSL